MQAPETNTPDCIAVFYPSFVFSPSHTSSLPHLRSFLFRSSSHLLFFSFIFSLSRHFFLSSYLRLAFSFSFSRLSLYCLAFVSDFFQSPLSTDSKTLLDIPFLPFLLFCSSSFLSLQFSPLNSSSF